MSIGTRRGKISELNRLLNAPAAVKTRGTVPAFLVIPTLVLTKTAPSGFTHWAVSSQVGLRYHTQLAYRVSKASVGGAKGAVAAVPLHVAKLLELLAEKVAVDKISETESPTLVTELGRLLF